jgi:hypothetical protein
MRNLVSLVIAAAMLVLTAAPALAGGGRQPQPTSSYSPSGAPMRHMESAAQQSRHGDPVSRSRPNPAPAPAAPASPYQPSYSIDRKEWWQPHPYFQSNGQGYGYPARPVRPYAGYGDNR